MAHFYLAEGLADSEMGAIVVLEGAEAKHAVSVSRIRVGESLSIGNGAGLVVTGDVVEAEPARLALRVDGVSRHPSPSPTITLAQALAKGGRDESAVQAATELGVDAVVPWAAQRSIARWDALKRAKGRERWQAIMREASKQSMRPHLPVVHELETTREIADRTRSSLVLVLEPSATTDLTAIDFDSVDYAGRDVVLVVGPEGGVAPQEIELLAAEGAVPVRLGAGIMRTSTAGPAAIAVLNARLGRW
ncbi:16S rRNA (uracil(1498)-N(3))-methyltransferase [Salinibacterium sp. SYSU T00001]|uniref:16S rRNA (uracil(1498)-N(3))-methyltransferase n=1 Tax=Homoserinimonas sedimenticola TaxID=2986805 RepID=UPI002235DC75|nr:16S rRNA (uracil(1498)-N(3))-methyltransferase [Salinibacterium sedimenticola]MCW4384594.1 16S rRNA (uracil(1498)-N(3))-methyltransferase [Salinibacterium sedimenticola]